MGTRLIFTDAEWITSELPVDDVAELMEAGRLIPAQRSGKRVLVNPVHVVSAEEWNPPAPRAADA